MRPQLKTIVMKHLQKIVEEDDAVHIKSILADLNTKKANDAKLLLVKQNIEKINDSRSFQFLDMHIILHII